MTSPPIGARSLLADQPLLLKAPQNAAEIAGIDTELLDQVAGAGLVVPREFIQHARLGERKRVPVVPQHANALGIEAVELPDCRDAFA